MNIGPIRITSPKTTFAGIGGALTALGGIFAILGGDGQVDWALMAPLLSALVSSLISAFGNLSARDNKVSSQQAGIRDELPPPPPPPPLLADAIQRSKAQ